MKGVFLLYVSTVLSNILFALETTHLLEIAQETFQMSKSTQRFPPGLKTLYIFNQSFCYTSDDEAAYVLYS